MTSPRIHHLMRSLPACLTAHSKSPPRAPPAPLHRGPSRQLCAHSSHQAGLKKNVSVGSPRLLCCMRPIGLPARNAMVDRVHASDSATPAQLLTASGGVSVSRESPQELLHPFHHPHCLHGLHHRCFHLLHLLKVLRG